MDVRAEEITESKGWAVVAHLGVVFNFVLFSFAGVLVPYIIYLIKRRENNFVARHARAAANFQMTMFLITFVSGLLGIGGHVYANSPSMMSIPYIGVVGGFLETVAPICAMIALLWATVEGVINAVRASDAHDPRYRFFSYPFVK